MDKSHPKTENNLALCIAEWLETDGWEVFEEVAPWGAGGGRADLVARKNKLIWIIETKNNFSLKLLEQAERWLTCAHFVSVGIWFNAAGIPMVERVCRKFQCGLLTVDDHFIPDAYHVRERTTGFFNRRAVVTQISAMLVAENRRTGKAGTGGEAYFTPYKKTIGNLVKTVTDNPGITLEEALRERHHYTDDKKAKRNILTALLANEFEEIRYERRGTGYVLYPNDCRKDADGSNGYKNAAESRAATQINLFE